MIRSFACKETECLFHGRFARRLPQDVQRVAQRRLRMLNQAEELKDLPSPEPAGTVEGGPAGRARQPHQ